MARYANPVISGLPGDPAYRGLPAAENDASNSSQTLEMTWSSGRLLTAYGLWVAVPTDIMLMPSLYIARVQHAKAMP